ncbi:M14 family zinc carboxypeptidase [Solirubrobacter taibaiensis]|nr:M14 family zinc carboxypeptidase [Solirubrobacter taibaiensis]
MSRRLLVIALVAAGAAPQAAQASSVLDTRVTASGSAAAPCQQALRRGAPGVVTRPVLAPSAGQLTVRLDGQGDWDVALFGADDRLVAGGGSPDGQEIAQGWTLAPGTLTVQACRRTGTGAATLSVAHEPLVGDRALARANAPQLVSVSTPTRADKDRLVALGMDLTEHGGKTALGVVLHGAADEAKLRASGFSWRVLVDDLVAEQARESAAPAVATTLPSGRTSYRQLVDYETELKTLAAQNPGFVRLFTLPNKTFQGRDVLGIEITENVTLNDGKPAFFNMGVHHAREWPAGELTMEWAYELINGYKAGDPRATRIVQQSRNLVVPIVNPDGFNGSRSVGAADGNDEATEDTVYIISKPGEYRRKNCRVGETTTASCTFSVGLAENGVDPNRNYAQFWGGPGSDSNPLTQTYRGSAPFSEPESRNVQWLVSRNQVTTLITNHTTAGLVLRAPGLAAIGDPVDEHRGYKALGDAMAKENGYFSQKSFELYDTTGTTEDWSYNATGGYGFTFELYCGAPNYDTGDCDDPAFHPRFATMAKEWDGTSPQADHAGYDGKGNREAFYLAAESTIDEARHSVLKGSAPAGARLTLTKDFKTDAFEASQQVDDHLETVLDVGDSGAFRWHVNPSTRPVVAKGSPNPGPPSPPQSASGRSRETPVGAFKDHPFTVPADGDNAIAEFSVTWGTPASDWDIELFQDTNRNGAVDTGEPLAGESAQGQTMAEQILVSDPAGAYVLRVTNFSTVEDYSVVVTFKAPQTARTESYTLTCTVGGAVVKTSQVVVERAAVARVDPCPAAASQVPGELPPKRPAVPATCTAPASLGVRPSGRGLTARGAVTLSRVTATGAKRVARFTDRFSKTARDGYYVVRGNGAPVALRRSGGKFRVLPAFERETCAARASLGRPLFGRSLTIAYRGQGPVRITVLRGTKVVKRLSNPATVRLARGVYRVRFEAGDFTATLTSRRL